MLIRLQALFFFLLLALFCPATVSAWPGRIVAVTDGDTLTLEPQSGGERVRVRLYGVDAPERKQTAGEAARGFAFTFLYTAVEVEPAGESDRYGRLVAIIRLPDGDTLQAALLRSGFAWVWPRYCTDCRDWQALQASARQSRYGLWHDDDPMEPWRWRHRR